MMKVLIILNRSANMTVITDYVNAIDKMDNTGVDFDIIHNNKIGRVVNNKYDMVIYQTFPVEDHKKFNKVAADVSDRYFIEFKGPKLLFDTHDDGNTDGFPRFNKGYDRIKTTVAYDKIDEYRVKFITGDPAYASDKVEFNDDPNVYFSYNVGYQPHGYGHFLRESTRDILLGSKHKDLVDMDRHKPFEQHIHNCKVMICPPGNCGHYEMYSTVRDPSEYRRVEGSEYLRSGISRRQLYTLNQGALLLNYKSLNGLKLFNDVDLIENVDYLTYDLNNLDEKLEFCINNPERVDKIRRNGFEKFRRGADLKNNALSFLKFIKEYYDNNINQSPTL